jgi:hypothetical protein
MAASRQDHESSKEDPMFPSHISHVAAHRHDEHLSRAERIRMVQRERRDGNPPLDRPAHRRMTAARLAAAATAFVLGVAMAANAAASTYGGGGGGNALFL